MMSHGAFTTERCTRASAAKERDGSSPLKPLRAGPHAAVKANPRMRASAAKTCSSTPKAKPRTRASVANERHSISKATSRKRVSKAQHSNLARKPRKPGVGVALEGEYEIQRIVDYRSTSYGDEYKVTWADTWVTVEDLSGAREALQEFRAERMGTVSKAPISTRVKGPPRFRRSSSKAPTSGTL